MVRRLYQMALVWLGLPIALASPVDDLSDDQRFVHAMNVRIFVDYRSRKFYTANLDHNGYSKMGLYGPDGQPKLARDVFRDLVWPVK